MFGASAVSRSVTFSSLTASFSSVLASHCRRSPFSYQTARHRSPSSRAGYTVIPHSSSITRRPSPRVPGRPVPPTKTWPRAALPVAAGTRRAALPRAGCGDFVGILGRDSASCAIRFPLFLR